MKSKWQQSWRLFKASLTVTLRHRKLLLFPLVTAVLTAVIGLFFLSAIALPLALHPTGYHWDESRHWLALGAYYFPPDPVPSGSHQHPAAASEGRNPEPAAGSPGARASVAPGSGWRYGFGLAAYLVSMFLATFFNAAFYSEILSALNGKRVSFRRGLATALSRWRPILAWSLLAGVVGWAIRTVAEKLPLGGRIVTGLIGLAWSIAAVFAIPVIIQEKPDWNPVKILRQSALTLKRTWGEALIGYTGISAGNVLLVALSLPALALAVALAIFLQNAWLGVGAGLAWGLGLMLLLYVSSVAGHVYRCALYLYAAEGVIAEPYDSELLDMAWKVKKV